MEEVKTCNGILCKGVEKQVSEFGIYSKSRDGLRSICNKCHNEANRIYYLQNKEVIKIKDKAYYKNNLEKEKLYRKIYAEKNADIIKIKMKEFRKVNAEKLHDQIQAKLKKREGYLKYLIVHLRAKDKKYGRACDIDYEYILGLIERQNNKCVYSGAELLWQNCSKDIHQGTIDRIDSSKGHIRGNCQLVTVPVNNFKTDLSHEKFIQLIGLISNVDKNDHEVYIETLSSIAKNKINTLYKSIKQRQLERLQKAKISELTAQGLDKTSAVEKSKELTLKDIEIDFDIKYIKELRKVCRDRCALTGLSLMWEPHNIILASIDRIDSSKGYSRDNIQITSWYVNCMKKDLSDEVAKVIIGEIVNHHKQKL